MTNREAIRKAAMELSPEERAELVEELIASLDPEDKLLFEDEWVEECDRRRRAIESGEMGTIDGEDFLRRLESGERP